MANNTVATEYTKTYTSFSGCDIVCTFGNTVIGELQAITYHVQREKAPIYTMGSAEPRSFSRGKRGIAGTLVFTIFDRDALIEGLKEHIASEQSFQRIGKDLNMQAITIDQWDSQMTDMASAGISGSNSQNAEEITKNVAATTTPAYADEIPPFDITVSFANEYGQKATLVLYGVEILNEGSGFSIDNVTSEKACTFVARKVEYMKPVDKDSN
jgi:hypothetical protein